MTNSGWRLWEIQRMEPLQHQWRRSRRAWTPQWESFLCGTKDRRGVWILGCLVWDPVVPSMGLDQRLNARIHIWSIQTPSNKDSTCLVYMLWGALLWKMHGYTILNRDVSVHRLYSSLSTKASVKDSSVQQKSNLLIMLTLCWHNKHKATTRQMHNRCTERSWGVQLAICFDFQQTF